MKYTDQQLINRVARLPTFRGFGGIVDIWVRSKADSYNLFDDKVYTFDCEGEKPEFISVNTGTSNAGSNGLKTPVNRLGCAVLASDKIVYNSHIYGIHKGKYPAYVENPANPFPYYRDNNRNFKAEEIGPIHTDDIGANCHHAGINSQFIDNWSEACLVRNVLAEFNAWMRFMNKRKFLTVAILNEF